MCCEDHYIYATRQEEKEDRKIFQLIRRVDSSGNGVFARGDGMLDVF